MSKEGRQATSHNVQTRDVHRAIIELMSALNRPQRDEALMREAGVTLDRALFRLLVVVDGTGPIGVVDLAERVGRDYTTVSRQVAKLNELGLVSRTASASDARVREARLTEAGTDLCQRVEAAREQRTLPILKHWSDRDLTELVRLMGKLTDELAVDPEKP